MTLADLLLVSLLISAAALASSKTRRIIVIFIIGIIRSAIDRHKHAETQKAEVCGQENVYKIRTRTNKEEQGGRTAEPVRRRPEPARKKKISGGGGRRILETAGKDSGDYTMTIIKDDDEWER